jgi:hypothetical protein
LAIDLLFNKKRADDRKDWLSRYDPEIAVDHNIKELLYRDFVHREFIHHSIYDNMRSIPSIVDGFKVRLFMNYNLVFWKLGFSLGCSFVKIKNELDLVQSLNNKK